MKIIRMGICLVVSLVGLELGMPLVSLGAEREPGTTGTYTFVVVQDGKDSVLYRMNTRTGAVWEYAERAIMKAEHLGLSGKEADSVNKMIEDAKLQGKNLFTLPHWRLTAEKPSDMYTVH